MVFRIRHATLINYQLHEGANVGVRFPRLRPFAGAHADYQFITNAKRLPRFQFDVAGVAVPLVQQADHSNPLCHWGAGHLGNVFRHRGGGGFRCRLSLFLGLGAAARVACGQEHGCRCSKAENRGPRHIDQTPSGDQAS